MIKLRHLAAASAVVLTLAVAAPPASAQWIVYDPTNFGQNVLTAARELQQINNQITMLTNQATSLVNQARNLANLPMSTLTQLQSSIAQTQSLLGQAQNIAFNVQRIEQAYSTSYGSAGGTGRQPTLGAAISAAFRSRRRAVGQESGRRPGAGAYRLSARQRHHVQRQLRRRDAGTVGNLPRRRDRRPDRGRHHGSRGDQPAPLGPHCRDPSDHRHTSIRRPLGRAAPLQRARSPGCRRSALRRGLGGEPEAILRQAGA